MSTRGRKAELQVIEGGLSGAPDIPESIPAGMHDEWRAVIADLEKRKVLTDAMLPTVESYILAISNMRMAQAALTKHGALIIGRDGIPKQNPAVSLLGKCNTAIQRLSAELGLTPASRSRKNMTGGSEEGGGNDGQISMFDL